MFQNPLNPQFVNETDPFNEMGSIDASSPAYNTSGETNPFISSQNKNVLTSGGNPGTHFVNPHQVDGYSRQDGTYVEGYWRDGDGNTDHDSSVEDGGGYLQTNPDGDITNNFGF
ncbi:hypothetical protein [Peribacillus asahii]|uniref:hypothetical protein n=1 Tax=Peribacillus asahii TaxID=228899 RepID=UPI00207A82B3|nr:hypothetical protein [Peribacillus asahii]USK86181.1 hypothetical protein LIT35_05935 [Peribacillus asahii]